MKIPCLYMSFKNRAAVPGELSSRDEILLADYATYYDYTSGDVDRVDVYMPLSKDSDFHAIAAGYPTITEYSIRPIILGFEKHRLTAKYDWTGPRWIYGNGVLYDEELDVFRLLIDELSGSKTENQILRPGNVAMIRKSGLCFATPVTTACFPYPHSTNPTGHDFSQKRGDTILEKDELAALAEGRHFPVRPAVAGFVGVKPSFDIAK